LAVDVMDGVTVTEVVLEGLILTDADGVTEVELDPDDVADALPVAVAVAEAEVDADEDEDPENEGVAVGKGLDAPPIGTSGQQNSSVVEY
jgi:hypothetical protein